MTKAASTASVSASELIGLGVVDIVSFVAQQRVGDTRTAERAAFERVEEHRFLRSGDLGDHAADGIDDSRAAPEADAVLEAGTVAVQTGRS